MGSLSFPEDDGGFGRQNSLLIDRAVEADQQDPSFEDIKGITKTHWLSSETRTKCFNKRCRKKFSFLDRPHHCRRCGEVFCLSCVQFKRKLNKLAKPDPDGKEHRVCQACFDQGPQELGATRNHLREFHQLKQASEAYKQAKTLGQRRRGWRNRFDLDAECGRLLKGFEEELKRSDISKGLMDMKKMVVVPNWQRGANWLQEDMFTSCQSCNTPFNLLLNKKRRCRVCAISVCGNCSSQKLILYVPDAEEAGERRSRSSLFTVSQELEPRLAVIEIVGCPDKEPEICLYLRVCDRCLEALTEIQVRDHHTCRSVSEDDFLPRLNSVWEDLNQTRQNIDDHLEQYCATIDSLENNFAGNANRGVKSKDNMRLLAKAQTDLSDFFTSYIMKVQHLKKLKQAPNSPAQAKLLQNFTKAKCEYYIENMYTFRSMRNKLADVSPPETLELIQKIVDKDAIVSSHLYIKQLVFEVIHLTDKHKVLPELAPILISVEEKVEKDAEQCLKFQGEDWEEHRQLVQQLLQVQIKNHKLIRPSQRLSRRLGSSHIRDITKQRSHEVIENIRLQLQLKSAHSSFQKSLEVLQKCRGAIKDM
ncbi:uncharacterized protein LOC135479265 [Liolophura sinensis]|uniref:uncharacterized protein LOC135479265 n=1 Tax=Liolophura sinensis TaxID=3198878 RepID=UPI00315959FF